MKLDFFQILYHESQRDQLYPFAKPYFSVGLTPYFENAIIAGIVPTSEADYIGVASWRLRKKRGDSIHYQTNKEELSLEKIDKALPFDVAILTPHSPSHKPLAMATNWHGEAWVNAFNAFKPFLRQFGKVPDELTYAIYENHFITKREIYHDYIRNWLIPAIDFMDNGDRVFFADSKYLSKKKDQTEIKRVLRLLQSNDWPICTFLLERLFSFYINDKGLKVINL